MAARDFCVSELSGTNVVDSAAAAAAVSLNSCRFDEAADTVGCGSRTCRDPKSSKGAD